MAARTVVLLAAVAALLASLVGTSGAIAERPSEILLVLGAILALSFCRAPHRP